MHNGGPPFLGVALRRASERATADVNHAAANDGKSQHALLAASRVPFAVLDDEGAQVLGESHFQLRQPVAEYPPSPVGELGQELLTSRRPQPVVCSLKCLADSIADVHVLYIDTGPGRRLRRLAGRRRSLVLTASNRARRHTLGWWALTTEGSGGQEEKNRRTDYRVCCRTTSPGEHAATVPRRPWRVLKSGLNSS